MVSPGPPPTLPVRAQHGARQTLEVSAPAGVGRGAAATPSSQEKKDRGEAHLLAHHGVQTLLLWDSGARGGGYTH